MRCRLIRILIDGKFDGSGGRIREKIIKNHIAKCSACREYYAEISGIDDMLRSASPEIFYERADGLAEKIISQLGAESCVCDTALMINKQRGISVNRFVLTGIAACLFIAAAVSVHSYKQYRADKQKQVIASQIADLRNINLLKSDTVGQTANNVLADTMQNEIDALAEDTKAAVSFILKCAYINQQQSQ